MSSRLQIFAIFVNFFFPALAFIFVCARAVGRVTTRQFGLDDWLVCIAMVMSITQTTISYFCKLYPGDPSSRASLLTTNSHQNQLCRHSCRSSTPT
jgi:hypothetical protein